MVNDFLVSHILYLMVCWQKRPSFKALGPINRAPVPIIWVIFLANFSGVSVCTTFRFSLHDVPFCTTFRFSLHDIPFSDPRQPPPFSPVNLNPFSRAMQHLVVFSRPLQCLVFFFCREFLDTMLQVQIWSC